MVNTPSTASKHDVGWAAGFIEGEGHIGFLYQDHPNGKSYGRLKLNVTQVYPEPLYKLVEVLGVGSVLGPYGPYADNKKPYYQYNVSGGEAVQAILQVLPYLFQKGEQARSALQEYKDYYE